jgi:hypothetical protein
LDVSITHLLFADDSIVFLEASEGSMLALKNILHDYEVSSGQRVNLQKSSIFFGPDCQAAMKNVLKSRIGISCEALSERYLGLPTVVRRSKEGCFKYITKLCSKKNKYYGAILGESQGFQGSRHVKGSERYLG